MNTNRKISWCVGCPNTLLWRHNGRDGVSNHQPHEYLLNHSFMRRSKKTSKLRVTGLCAGTSPETGEFPAQMVSNAENVSIWWRHHECALCENKRDNNIEVNGSEVKWAECSLIIGTGCWVHVFSLILDSSVGLWVGIQSDFPASNPAFSRGRQLVCFRFENRLPAPEHRN